MRWKKFGLETGVCSTYIHLLEYQGYIVHFAGVSRVYSTHCWIIRVVQYICWNNKGV